MKMSLGTSVMTEKARKDHKGFPWYGEIAIFVLIFAVSQIAAVPILVIPQMMLIFRNPEVIAALQAGDMTRYMELATGMESPGWFMALELFSTIVPLLVTLGIGRLLGKRKLSTYGFFKKGMIKEYLIGLVVGFLMFSGAVLICVVTGAAKLQLSAAFSPIMLVIFFLGFMIQGMEEEIMCRGFLLTSFSRRYSVVAAVILNSVVFAALHLANPGISPLALINLTLAGLTFSVYYVKSNNIWGCAAMHSIWNFVQGNFYGIKVSGMNFRDSVFVTTNDVTKSVINGGDFGFEGGLGVTVVEVVALILFLVIDFKKNEKIEN